jgi:TRAP-type C4-dicarboxylate transport system substrate-binding protein
LSSFALPGSSELCQAQQTQAIKIAMLSPRNGTTHQALKKLSDYVVKETNNAAEFHIYPSGVAGDEVDAIRKMQLGQMDGAIVTTTGLSLLEAQTSVLDAPGVINDFSVMDAVLKELHSDIENLLAKKQVQYLFSVPNGGYRIFSKGVIVHVSDMKRHRFWLWPASYISKEWLREAGVTGVPLGANDVFGALQAGTVDALTSTSISVVALRWHTKLDFVSASSRGILDLHFVVNKSKWDALPQNVKTSINNHLEETRVLANRGLRDDVDTYNKLIARGYTAGKPTPQIQTEWDDLSARVRKRLVGRVFPAALLDKVMAIAKKSS